MDFGEGSPVIIKKKKDHGGHHGGAWKVAYADFVTAMMALFIVLWILSQGEEVKEAVAGYFKDPVGFSSSKGRGVMELKGSTPIDLELKQRMEAKEIEKQRLAQMGDNIINELSQDTEFKGLMDQIQVEIVDEGLKIELMESVNDAFFEIGSSQLNKNAQELLTKIAKQLSKLNNKISIEGHTDSRPYSGSGRGYTNFELSAERANSARRVLTSAGLNENMIDQVTGYADKRLRNKKDSNDVVNRRISIIVKYSG
jgi:chemotaxis protein MotB